MVEIYVGAAYKPITNMGGWGVVLVEEGQREKRHNGSESGGTHQRMILKAAVEGLDKTEQGCEATIFSNNEYLVLGINDSRQRIKHRDLWGQFDELESSRKVKAEYLKKHQWLGEAQILANEAAGG